MSERKAAGVDDFCSESGDIAKKERAGLTNLMFRQVAR